MFDLLGSGMPLAARFFIAFLVVLALIGVTAWLVRRFGSSRLGGAGARGRQPRLAVIDAASVDGRRRLVLIRRDNIEHLLMIGGPTDVVIEPNIVRAAPATRSEPTMRAPAGPPPPPASETAWPLQPTHEPAPVAPPLPPPVAPAAPPRPSRASATEEPWLPGEPGGRPRPSDSLTGMAAEFSSKLPDLPPPTVTRPEPVVAPPPLEPPPSPQTDRNLAEMAQQLEAALRRTPEGRPPVTDPLAVPPPVKPERSSVRDFKPRSEPKFEPRPEPKLEATPENKFEPKLDSKFEPKLETKFDTKFDSKFEPKFEFKPEPEAKPEPAATKSLYDNLEEEMASLLGRPPGKS